ncbi:MAG: hypothetical protein GXO00_00325 [Candidatus Diapherotrites archaeon]|nr:hypothetical protein [Candidatus Diapherotrites archaeon]
MPVFLREEEIMRQLKDKPAIIFSAHGGLGGVNSAVYSVLKRERYVPSMEAIEHIERLVEAVIRGIKKGEKVELPEIYIVERRRYVGDSGRYADVYHYRSVDPQLLLLGMKTLLEDAELGDDLDLAMNYLRRYYFSLSPEERKKEVFLVKGKPRTKLGAAVQLLLHSMALVAKELAGLKGRHMVLYHGERVEHARRVLRGEQGAL